VVFYLVIGSALKVIGHFGPLVGLGLVAQEQYPLLILAPRDLADLRIQVVVPAFPTLLSDSSRQMLRNEASLLRSVLLDQIGDLVVFLRSSDLLLNLLLNSLRF